MSHAHGNAIAYVQRLGRISAVKRIYLFGSRSPKASKPARTCSDWDFAVVTDQPRFALQSPRDTLNFNADCINVHDVNEKRWLGLKPSAVEIWPNDTIGFFDADFT